jgi:hypothetical protein
MNWWFKLWIMNDWLSHSTLINPTEQFIQLEIVTTNSTVKSNMLTNFLLEYTSNFGTSSSLTKQNNKRFYLTNNDNVITLPHYKINYKKRSMNLKWGCKNIEIIPEPSYETQFYGLDHLDYLHRCLSVSMYLSE